MLVQHPWGLGFIWYSRKKKKKKSWNKIVSWEIPFLCQDQDRLNISWGTSESRSWTLATKLLELDPVQPGPGAAGRVQHRGLKCTGSGAQTVRGVHRRTEGFTDGQRGPPAGTHVLPPGHAWGGEQRCKRSTAKENRPEHQGVGLLVGKKRGAESSRRLGKDRESCPEDVTSTHWAAASPSAGRTCSWACRHCCRSARAWGLRQPSAIAAAASAEDRFAPRAKQALPPRAWAGWGGVARSRPRPERPWPRP
jgi:hypothetical protein